MGTELIGTMAALVLGLLISSAKSSYDTESGQVEHMTGDIILLDRLLGQYGQQANASRDLLRRAIGPLIARIWRENSFDPRAKSPSLA